MGGEDNVETFQLKKRTVQSPVVTSCPCWSFQIYKCVTTWEKCQGLSLNDSDGRFLLHVAFMPVRNDFVNKNPVRM